MTKLSALPVARQKSTPTTIEERTRRHPLGAHALVALALALGSPVLMQPAAAVTLPESIPDFSQDTSRPSVTSVASGSWSNASTWQGGQIPTANHVVRIAAAHTVTINDTAAVAYTIAVDGKLSATGIELKGRGTSSEEIRNNLTGKAGLSGFVYPVVTQGSLGFARFATSVGSLFSSDMAFNSAMLQGFVNRQNPITGQMSIGGGMVTLQNPKVAGANTTATIASSTSLATETTNTVVSINTNNDRTTDFVINVTGPLAKPVVTTGRGPPSTGQVAR